MIRRPALALLLALIPGLASAQFATIAPTPPTADNGDRIATTAWARNFLSGGLLLPSGQIFIGSVGGLAVAQTPSADLTVSTGGAFTLATVNGNTGAFGSATQCVTVTNNAKGLTTAVSAATCTPAIGSITGLGTGIATALGVNVGTAGSVVVNGGALGTPSSGTLTSATGLPISTGLTGAGTGVLTALGVNIGSAGAFTTFSGAHGTPSSITLTNATGLPISTGLTGAGTGILAALGTNTGSAGAPVLFNGAGGTPTSIVLTNGTGTAASLTAGNVTTNANLTGDVTSVGNATTLTNAPVIAKVLTGYSAGAGTVASTDSILQALQKLGGLVDNAAWGTYTPATTCNTGAGTWTANTAKFKAIGKTVHWQIDVTLSAVGTCANSVFKFNLPSTPVSGGGGAGAETATSGAAVTCGFAGGSAVVSCSIAGTVLAVNARYVASGVYEGP